MQNRMREPENEYSLVTGLPTIRNFIEQAGRTVKKHRDDGVTYTLLYCDMEHFTQYNRLYGLDVGDRLLRDIADILQEVFNGDLIGHLESDQFAVLTVSDHVDHQVREAQDKIRNLYPDEKNTLFCRFGGYEWVDPDVSPEEALQFVKMTCDSLRGNHAESYAYFSVELQKKMELCEYVCNHIEQAVKNGWIQVYYQPIVRTATKEVCAMEALARWDDPQYGMMTPDMFLEPLEDSELIYKLDLFIIDEICRQCAEVHMKGGSVVPVSLNVDRPDFLKTDLFRAVETAVKKYGVPREYIRIEVSERVFSNQNDVIAVTLERFRNEGYEIWIDDFGSAYSTLNLLKDTDYDLLKIDMAFLRGDTPRSRSIIRAVVAMSESLGGHSLTEGVETEEQFQFLCDIGCDFAQGYYFGKPMPYTECRKSLDQQGIAFEKRSWEFLSRTPSNEECKKLSNIMERAVRAGNEMTEVLTIEDGKPEKRQSDETGQIKTAAASSDAESKGLALSRIFSDIVCLNRDYMVDGRHYTMIACHYLPNYREKDRYGQRHVNDVQKTVMDTIRRIGEENGAIVDGFRKNSLEVYYQYEKEEELEKLADQIRDGVSQIHEVNGIPTQPEIRVEIVSPNRFWNTQKRIFEKFLIDVESGMEIPELSTEVAAAEGQLRQILDVSPLGAYIIKPDRTIVYWNRRAEEITGYSKAWMVGSHCNVTDLHHVDCNGTELCTSYCPFFSVLATGKSVVKQVSLHRRDGELVPIHAYFTPIQDANGTIVEVLETFIPVSQKSM